MDKQKPETEKTSSLKSSDSQPPSTENKLSLLSLSEDSLVKAGLGAVAIAGTAALVVASRGRAIKTLAKEAEAETVLGSKSATLSETARLETKDLPKTVRELSQNGTITDEQLKLVKSLVRPEVSEGRKALEAGKRLADLEAKAGRTPLQSSGEEALSGREHLKDATMRRLAVKQQLEFSASGRLMPGRYPMNFERFAQAFGEGEKRQQLLGDFLEHLHKLKAAGVNEVHVGGSFVSKKANPNDLDFMWNRLAPGVNQKALGSPESAALAKSNAPELTAKGLQAMVGPGEHSSYEAMKFFFTKQEIALPGRFKPNGKPDVLQIPNGLVELKLDKLPPRLPPRMTPRLPPGP